MIPPDPFDGLRAICPECGTSQPADGPSCPCSLVDVPLPSPPHLFSDGCVIRKARKPWKCMGDGAGGSYRRHACTDRVIPVGAVHMEFDPLPIEGGSKHCMACARAFFTRQPKPPHIHPQEEPTP